MIQRAICRLSAAMSTTNGFVAVMLSLLIFMATGGLFRWSEEWQLVFTLYLSILAIVQASVILVGQRNGEAAIHAKLDEVIRAIDKADNRLIGIEKTGVPQREAA